MKEKLPYKHDYIVPSTDKTPEAPEAMELQRGITKQEREDFLSALAGQAGLHKKKVGETIKKEMGETVKNRFYKNTKGEFILITMNKGTIKKTKISEQFLKNLAPELTLQNTSHVDHVRAVLEKCRFIDVPGYLSYAFTGNPDKNQPGGADCYQAGIDARKEAEAHQSEDEDDLIFKMPERQRALLATMDCFVYLGVGDGTRFLTFLQGIYQAASLDELKGILNQKRPRLKVILKDKSADFLLRANTLLMSYNIITTCELGNFTEPGVTKPNTYKTCYVSLGNTASNFDMASNIQQLQQSRQYRGRTFWYISTTLPKDNTAEMEQGYKEKRIEIWLQETFRAACGDKQAHMADCFMLDTVAHEAVEIKITTKKNGGTETHHIQPARVLIGLKLSDEACKAYPNGLDIILPVSKEKATFYPGITYYIFASYRYNTPQREYIIDKGGAYKDDQKTLLPVYATKIGEGAYESKNRIIHTTDEGKVSIFTELQPLPYPVSRLEKVIYPLLSTIVAVILLNLLSHTSPQSTYNKNLNGADINKLALLKDYYAKKLYNTAFIQDSLPVYKGKIDTHIKQLIATHYIYDDKKDQKTIDHILGSIWGVISSLEDKKETSTLLDDIIHYSDLPQNEKEELNRLLATYIIHFNDQGKYISGVGSLSPKNPTSLD